MSREQALAQAAGQAVTALRGVDLRARLERLGMPAPEGRPLPLRLFGQDALLDLDDLQVRSAVAGTPVRPTDRVLLLHYLRHEGAVVPTDRLVSFREFPGGAFYVGPFRARTVDPLVVHFGNDVAALRGRLSRFDTAPVALGDLGARIHAFGALHVTLIYRCGDDELAPSAEVLFDAAALPVFGAEDAAVLASRICLGLL